MGGLYNVFVFCVGRFVASGVGVVSWEGYVGFLHMGGGFCTGECCTGECCMGGSVCAQSFSHNASTFL